MKPQKSGEKQRQILKICRVELREKVKENYEGDNDYKVDEKDPFHYCFIGTSLKKSRIFPLWMMPKQCAFITANWFCSCDSWIFQNWLMTGHLDMNSHKDSLQRKKEKNDMGQAKQLWCVLNERSSSYMGRTSECIIWCRTGGYPYVDVHKCFLCRKSIASTNFFVHQQGSGDQ